MRRAQFGLAAILTLAAFLLATPLEAMDSSFSAPSSSGGSGFGGGGGGGW